MSLGDRMDIHSDQLIWLSKEEVDASIIERNKKITELENNSMKDAFNDIAELLHYEHLSHSEVAKVILPFVSESNMVHIAILSTLED